jgi:hypothetical protein
MAACAALQEQRLTVMLARDLSQLSSCGVNTFTGCDPESIFYRTKPIVFHRAVTGWLTRASRFRLGERFNTDILFTEIGIRSNLCGQAGRVLMMTSTTSSAFFTIDVPVMQVQVAIAKLCGDERSRVRERGVPVTHEAEITFARKIRIESL